MRLTDLPGLLLQDIIGTWRRRIIAGGVIGICAIGVVVEGFSAARHALEQSFGPVGARLILAGIFLIAMIAAAIWLQMAERANDKTAASAKSDERTVLIAEALSLGYTLAQEFGRKPQNPPGAPTEASQDAPPPSNRAATDDRPPA